MNRFILVLTAGLLFGCGSEGSGGPPEAPGETPTINVSGLWKGPATSAVCGEVTASMDLRQKGKTITGTFTNSAGASGSVEGTVAANRLSFTITPRETGCTGLFSGTAEVDTEAWSEIMNFRYEGGSSCLGTDNDVGTLMKQ